MPELPKTPTRTTPSMVDMAAQLRAQVTPYSVAESKSSTPPSSNPLVELYGLTAKQCRDFTTTPDRHPGRRVPVPQLSHEPATPQNRALILPEVKFTPFHDLKETIDDWMGDLPAEFQGLIHPDDQVFVERRQTNNATHLSLYLCSPANSSKPVQILDADDTPTRGLRTRVVQTSVSEVQDEAQVSAEKSHLSQSEEETTVTNPAPKRHKSLLRKTARVLKKTIKLLIPYGVHSKPGRRTPALPQTEEELCASSESAQPTTTRIHPNHQFLYHAYSPQMSQADMRKDSETPTIYIPHRRSAFPLPTITATETFPFFGRSPQDMTSTTRKPVPIRNWASGVPHPRTPPTKNLTALQSPAKIVSAGIIDRSEHGSFYDLAALQPETELSFESREVKAVASLSVMAMAAGADFLREDEMFHAAAVGKRKGGVPNGWRRRVRMPN